MVRSENNLILILICILRFLLNLYLVGIEEVVVGWRDDAGIVEQVETLPVSSLPKRGMEWRANVCANFLLEFITFIHQNLLRDSSDQVYYFTFFLNLFSCIKFLFTPKVAFPPTGSLFE